jgi:hypothetical protein
MLAIMLSSHDSDSAAEATGPRRDVDVESLWRQCCRVMLAMMLQLNFVLVVVRLRSPRDQCIDVLSHHEEVGYFCWLIAE